MRILLIDDDGDLRNLLERYITQQGPDSEVAEYDPLDHDIPAASFAPGSYDLVIPDYMLVRGMGDDAMSRVYLASRIGAYELLVVKILRSEVMSARNAVARFTEESALVERIQSRHVARIYTPGAYDGHAYLVMEFFEGGELNKRLGGKALPAEEAVRLFRDLMFALGVIHEKGILHRDLKPPHLLFRPHDSLASA